MYHVSAQGVDERMMNVHYCYSPAPLIRHCMCVRVRVSPDHEKKPNLFVPKTKGKPVSHDRKRLKDPTADTKMQSIYIYIKCLPR